MKKKQIAGLVVAAALFVGVSAASVFTNTICKNMLQSSVKDVIDLGGSCNCQSRRDNSGTDAEQRTGNIKWIPA